MWELWLDLSFCCFASKRKVFSGEVDHRGALRRIDLIDTPGFGDPEKPDGDTLRALSRATVDIAEGVDVFLHIVKMDRMNDMDRNLPEILLTGLADDDETRQEMAARYLFVVTHADSSRGPADPAKLDQFKGEMRAFFPEILHSAVQNAIFVEHGPKLGSSPYGDAVVNRDLILDHAMDMRQVHHRVFKSKKLDAIIQKGFATAMNMWKTDMGFDGQRGRSIKAEELGGLLNFFNQVIQQKKWIHMTEEHACCTRFRGGWNNMNRAVRDEVAVQVAKSVIQEVQVAAVFPNLCVVL